MKSAHTDFGSLYRAAFAERDPDKKLVLLSQVQKEIKLWEHDDVSVLGKPSPQAQFALHKKAAA
jgi:hypothetical protein